MSTNPTLNYLLKGNEEASITESDSKTKLTLENPSLNYLVNPTNVSQKI